MSPYISALQVTLCVTILWCQAALGAESQLLSNTSGQPLLQEIDELNIEKLQSEISIASGQAQSVEEAPGIVSVIKAETISRMGARTLQDVLETVPGFEVLTDNLGRSRLVVRGLTATGGESVLILFNGNRLNETITGGATAINLDIPVDNLERVEIIRGPGSALFGANAFAGVINLIPYTAERFDGIRRSDAGGTFATQKHNILASQTYGDFQVSAFFQYGDTNGSGEIVPEDAQSAQDAAQAAFFPPTSRAPGETDEERRSVDANVHLAYKDFALTGRFKDERSGGYIGAGNRLSDSRLENRQLNFDVRYRYALGSTGSVAATFNFAQHKSRQLLELLPPGTIRNFVRFDDGFVVDFDVKTRRFGGQVVLDYEGTPHHHFTFGISFSNESTFDLQAQGNFSIGGRGGFTPQDSFQPLPFSLIRNSSRDILSVWLQDIWSPLPTLDVTLGARYDHFSDFGDTVDPRVGIVWRFAKPFYLKLLYGSAFRAPTFTELNFAATGLPELPFIGNPDLDSSTLQTFEAALGYTHPRVRISVNYFLTLVRDFIRPLGVLVEPPTFTNSLDIDIQGVEVDVRANVYNHTLFMNYTFQHPTDKTTGDRLPDVPSHLANLGVSLGIGPYVRFTPTLLIRGSRPRVEMDPRSEAPAYALVNASLLVRNIFRTLEISGTVHNLFDTSYEDPAPISTVPGDYPRSGRSVLIKLTYQF